MEAGPTSSEAEAKVREVWRAIAVTAGLYGGYSLLRAILPIDRAFLGLALVAAFYLLPLKMLRGRPELMQAAQLSEDRLLPPWSARGAKVAGLAAAAVFPPFVLLFFAFYWRVCDGDLAVLSPVLWVEEWTPWAGKLEQFMSRLCHGHPGSFWPRGFHWPERWTEYGGLGFLSELAVGTFAVALPEEIFHRGYLMTVFERRWKPRYTLLGVPFGWAAVLSSALFALGHLVGMAETARLGTFFPALLFAWLWRRSGSLWAPTLFHLASNLLMDLLLASTFAAR